MKTVGKLLLFILLFSLPIAARWLQYHPGKYAPPESGEITPQEIALPVTTYQQFVDNPTVRQGRILFDLAHDNNLLIDDLTPLKDRLTGRGMQILYYDGYSQELSDQLRGALAYLVIAPTYDFSEDELSVIRSFVEDGGKLLIAADPTRPVPMMDEGGFTDLFSTLFPISAIPAVNQLAGLFGIEYYDDYLYNLQEYEGNYRNVRFREFASDQPLTGGLEEIVLSAAHSIRSDGTPLIWGDEKTFSNVRTGENKLSAAVLAEAGRVLALGDVTFLTPPNHSIADNDHFLSNLADWASSDSRVWDVEDFPYLFVGPVDQLTASAKVLDPLPLENNAPLQEVFKIAGIEINLRSEPDPEHDLLILATYAEPGLAEEYLAAAGVSLDVPASSAGSGNDADSTANNGQVEIDGFGTFYSAGSSLFLVNQDTPGQTVLVVMAEDIDSFDLALDRLIWSDFYGCAGNQTVTLCSTGDAISHETTETEENRETAQEETIGTRIFIFSNDTGDEGVSTGVDELEAILSEYFQVTVWAASQDGIPSLDELSAYDAFILTSGDYAYGPEDDEAYLNFLSLEGNVLVMGDQPLPPDLFANEPAQLLDLQVVDGAHPIASGFDEAEIIALLDSASQVPSIVIQEDELNGSDSSRVIFARGPDSPHTGEPAVIALEELDQRIVLAAFAFYRLPETTRELFILNVVDWLLGY